MKTIGVSDAEAQLSELLERVERGERFTITRAGKPVAVLLPADEAPASEEDVERLVRAQLEIARRCAARPAADSRGADEILGFDEAGLPS